MYTLSMEKAGFKHDIIFRTLYMTQAIFLQQGVPFLKFGHFSVMLSCINLRIFHSLQLINITYTNILPK